jgi:3-phosphoshikimate 1-carboxyvinyltransferase
LANSKGEGESVNDRVEIQPRGAIRATVRPPGSKSITNRALICAALAEGESRLTGVLDSDDTRVMIDSLRRLGLRLRFAPDAELIEIRGCGGVWPAKNSELFIGNSGTSIRFLTAALAVGEGVYRLDGIHRMRERPIGDLLTALNEFGSRAYSEKSNGCPPVVVHARGIRGGRAEVRGDVSSQFLSGLLMALPYACSAVELRVRGELVSQPYVRMTLEVMKSFGVATQNEGLASFAFAGNQHYQGCDYSVEPDASAASYFWGAAAVTGGEVTVQGLSRKALQGDVAFCDCLAQMGCQVTYRESSITVAGRASRGATVNMNAISDTAQTLAAVALFAEGPTTITGVGHNRHKETDRIGDLARELRKLGAKVEEFDDGFRVTPGSYSGAEVDTYNDHRMAMSLALAGLKIPGVVVRDPACTAKTYPRFFEDFAKL